MSEFIDTQSLRIFIAKNVVNLISKRRAVGLPWGEPSVHRIEGLQRVQHRVHRAEKIGQSRYPKDGQHHQGYIWLRW